MTTITAFDSKDFKRSNKAGEMKFYTPLGCGVKISKPKEFQSLYIDKLQELLKTFEVEPICGCLASSEYFRRVGHAKTYKISDELLKAVQHLIDSVYFTYVILPSASIPEVEVGGYRSPTKTIDTFDFLRQLSVYFSYITAWNYLGIETRKNELILIDGFHGKRTPAWDDMIEKTKPMIYPHGDECNVYVSTADMIASLTDKKLWDNFLRLIPENIAEVWKGYSFDVKVHFLDQNILSKIKWNSDEHIDLSEYYARPIVFMKADGFKTDEIKKLTVYPEATMLARKLNGCVQGFDKEMDSSKIKDGDVFVYAGKEAEALAATLKDLYEIQILPFKELKKVKSL